MINAKSKGDQKSFEQLLSQLQKIAGGPAEASSLLGSDMPIKLSGPMFAWGKEKAQKEMPRRSRLLESEDSELGAGLSDEDVKRLLDVVKKGLAKAPKGGAAAISIEASTGDVAGGGEPLDKRVSDRMKMRQMLEQEEASGNRELRGAGQHEHPATGRDDESEFEARQGMREEMGGSESAIEDEKLKAREMMHKRARGR